MLGDVVGKPGRKAVADYVPRLRKQYNPELVVANAENAAGGLGITPEIAEHLLDAGVDVLTLGNHTFTKKEISHYLDIEPRIIRPANFPPGVPGRGYSVFTCSTGISIGVINLIGRTFMTPVDDPFRAADAVLKEIRGETRIAIIDMHAKATSEKMAIGWYLNGRATAVLGTHTHVQTSDERILSGGTAYITDIGMVGPRDSVLGLKTDLVIERFLTQIQTRFEAAQGTCIISGVVIDVDPETGRAFGISRISIEEPSDEAVE
jgi:2',3'-cyclic-nucleotide 2'-phosphodiesterase